jgi:hypothetical protein
MPCLRIIKYQYCSNSGHPNLGLCFAFSRRIYIYNISTFWDQASREPSPPLPPRRHLLKFDSSCPPTFVGPRLGTLGPFYCNELRVTPEFNTSANVAAHIKLNCAYRALEADSNSYVRLISLPPCFDMSIMSQSNPWIQSGLHYKSINSVHYSSSLFFLTQSPFSQKTIVELCSASFC